MADGLDLLKELPTAPNPSDQEINGFHRQSDWINLFFEWHQTIGIVALVFSHLTLESPTVKRISRLKYIILTALLNRCSRLMMANLRLASEDRHSEAMSVIDRSLHETALKLIWLCRSQTKDRFERYLADGLRNDLQFRNHIRSNIKRQRTKTELESRMLKSIRRSISTSKLSSHQINAAPKIPDLYSMTKEAGYKDIAYIVIQRMGSHHVHGTWTGLLSSAIDVEGPTLKLRPDFNPPHPNQLMFGSLIVLEAVMAFVQLVIKRKDRSTVLEILEAYQTSLLRHNSLMAVPDLRPAL